MYDCPCHAAHYHILCLSSGQDCNAVTGGTFTPTSSSAITYSELKSIWQEAAKPYSFLQAEKFGSKPNDSHLHLGGAWSEPRIEKSTVLIGDFRGLP
jgi:hypothetical protein